MKIDYKTEGQVYKQDNMQIIHADCMEIMKQTPDNYYDLAVCDVPYGIDAANTLTGPSRKSGKGASYKTETRQLELF